MTLAHLARWAAAIFLLDAAETCRLDLAPAWPLFRLAHRAFCAKLIFLRAEADIFRRVPVRLIEFERDPDRAETAASSRPNSNAALSRAAFNCASMSICPPRVGIVTNGSGVAFTLRGLWKFFSCVGRRIIIGLCLGLAVLLRWKTASRVLKITRALAQHSLTSVVTSRAPGGHDFCSPHCL